MLRISRIETIHQSPVTRTTKREQVSNPFLSETGHGHTDGPGLVISSNARPLNLFLKDIMAQGFF